MTSHRPVGSGRRWAVDLQRYSAASSRWIGTTTYLKKWLVLGMLIGAIAGSGAIVFYEALRLATHLLLGDLGGYRVSTPAGEGSQPASPGFSRPWAIPLVVGGGALLGALLVYRFAPDAEGHGTDAAISAVHHNPRGIRFRTVVVKIVASALTIGSGGSGGREGPTGQISAGFASLLARFLDLSPADARVAVATGIGSGIGSIFGAPLGGAVLATEIPYRDDFEVEVLLPGFIASIVGYVIYASVEGFTPLFGYIDSYHFTNPTLLAWFALIGVLGGLVGLLYAKGFYGIAALFERSPGPRWLRPAVGGLLVGAIGLAIPEVLGTGYGFIQVTLGPSLATLPLWIVLIVPFARIVATGLSIGSGGSGGIFGPGMVIGAFLGASVWRLFAPLVPSMGHDPAPYVIIGMMCCFGSIARAPLAVMLMVAEMTGSLSILAPAMVAVGIATLIVRRNDDTIYRSQLRSRADAPAHRLLTGMPLLAAVPAAQAMVVPRLILASDSTVTAAKRSMTAALVPGAPVVDGDGRLLGVVSLHDLEETVGDPGKEIRTVVDDAAPVVAAARNLDVALDALTVAEQSWIAVIDNDRHVVGTLAISDLLRAYRVALQTNLRRMEELGSNPGTLALEVGAGSYLEGRRLANAGIPRGTIITTIQRGRELLLPAGDTQFRSGDRLVVLGQSSDIDRFEEMVKPCPQQTSELPGTTDRG